MRILVDTIHFADFVDVFFEIMLAQVRILVVE